MAEWSNAHDSKSCYVGTRTEVRILFSAPKRADSFCYPPVLLCRKRVRNSVGSCKPARAPPRRRSHLRGFYGSILFSAPPILLKKIYDNAKVTPCNKKVTMTSLAKLKVYAII